MKVVVLGSGQIFTNLIAGSMDAGCDIVGVFRFDRVRLPLIDRFIIDTFNPSKEYTYIKSHKLYEINARSANSAEFKKEILRLNADIIIVGSWGEKLKKPIIDLPKLATINVHPGILPKYRGPNPYLEAIRHLEIESGVTFHLMDENFDSGPILLQKNVPIEENDTSKELRERIAVIARDGVKELMIKLNEEIIIPVKQDEKKANYYPQISENDVMLDFSKTAKEISAHIRAFHPWTRCFFQYNKHFFIPNPYGLEVLDNNTDILEVGTIVEKSHKDKSITVVCGDNKLLKMHGLKLYGALKFLTNIYIKYRVKHQKRVY